MFYCGTYLLEEQTKGSWWKLSVGPEAAAFFLCFYDPARLGGQRAALSGEADVEWAFRCACHLPSAWCPEDGQRLKEKKKKRTNKKVCVCGFSCGETWLAGVEYEEEQNKAILYELWFFFFWFAWYVFSLSPCFSHSTFSFGTIGALRKSGGVIFLTVSHTTSQLWHSQFREGCWKYFKSRLRVRAPLSKEGGAVPRSAEACTKLFPDPLQVLPTVVHFGEQVRSE